jgi:hypothetical protein
MKAGTLSLRGLARLIGVDDKSVRKAMQAGVFSTAAVTRAGSGSPVVIDATLAVDEWQKSGRQLRGSDRRQAPAAVGQAPPPPSSSGADGRAVLPVEAEIKELLGRVRQLQEALPPTTTHGDPAEDLPPPAGTDSPTLVKAQTEAAIQRGRQLRMENDEREGLLVPADKAATEAFDFARTLRENILNIPARLSAELAAESDAGTVHRRLEDALREALESTANTLDAAAPPGDGGRVLVAL